MEQSTYRYLRSQFGQTTYQPGGPDARRLMEHMISSQADAWMRLIRATEAQSSAQGKIERSYRLNEVTQSLERFVHGAIDGDTFRIEDRTEGQMVVGRIPIIVDIDSPSPGILNSRSDDLMSCFAGAFLYECGRVKEIALFRNDPTPIYIVREMQSYAAWRAVEIAFGQERESATGFLAVIRTNIAEIEQATGSAKQSVEEVTTFAAGADAQLQLVTEHANEIETSFKIKLEDVDKKLAGFLDAAKARSTYENLKIHWQDRADQAWWGVTVSWIVLAFFLVAAPAIAIYENEVIVGLIARIASAANVALPSDAGPVALTIATVSRLIIITIPLALYFWLIRLVVRYNMRSMLLMDDARLRATIIETYYKMIEERAATVEDRALILSALCRPAPGHGGDTVEPPNFTEVIDKAMGK